MYFISSSLLYLNSTDWTTYGLRKRNESSASKRVRANINCMLTHTKHEMIHHQHVLSYNKHFTHEKNQVYSGLVLVQTLISAAGLKLRLWLTWRRWLPRLSDWMSAAKREMSVKETFSPASRDDGIRSETGVCSPRLTDVTARRPWEVRSRTFCVHMEHAILGRQILYLLSLHTNRQ